MRIITLQSRIIILLTIFAIVTIGIFVTIQLAHELDAIDGYIGYKSKNDALIIEKEFSEILGLSLPEEEKIGLLGKGLGALKRSQSIQKGYIFDRRGKIVVSTESWALQEKGDYDDFDVLAKLNQGESVRGQSTIDKSSKILSLYVPLKEKGDVRFIVRLFFPLADIWKALAGVYHPAMFVGALIIIVNICLGVFLARLIIGPIRVFNEAAKTIASGRLDLRIHISTSDELEELAGTFNFMTKELVRMRDRAENANPLTKLPGNILIMEEVERKIEEDKKFTVIYSDLDNFKAFNDKYGIHKGDEAIQLTSQILKEALKVKGNPEDFVGHEGGDDFLLLTTPGCAHPIAEHIISEFDSRIRSLYDDEDLTRGYIIAHARDGSVQHFAIMTISLIGVTNQHRVIRNYAEVTNIAAEVKKKAKKEEVSCFVVDRRKE
ncbi:MAG: diguanylate cyclase [Candidatus Omnitrophota bacterium]|nr:MAG: diguanylate cyclase [Candidatus Omnitrophota bacterium]